MVSGRSVRATRDHLLTRAFPGPAITDLAETIDPQTFEERFGPPLNQLRAPVEANTGTISRLIETALSRAFGVDEPSVFIW